MSDPSDGDRNGPTGKSEELRVKDVSEINGITSSTNDVEAQNGTKRKLPSWMVTANSNGIDETQNKRSKTTENGADSLGECSNEEAPSENNAQQSDSPVVKIENETENENPSSEHSDEPNSSADANVATTNNNRSDDNVEVKVERDKANADTDASTSTGVCSTNDIKRAVKVEKADASSSSRESCKFGIRCYRVNPMHRIEEAHPGDHDYKRPHYPPPADDVPDCPYGNSCYRRNPTHFQQFKHPDDN